MNREIPPDNWMNHFHPVITDRYDYVRCTLLDGTFDNDIPKIRLLDPIERPSELLGYEEFMSRYGSCLSQEEQNKFNENNMFKVHRDISY